MIASNVRHLLEREGVPYATIRHAPAFTARETADAAHVPGHDFAKTVIVKLDDRLAMAVLPASEKLDVERLKKAAAARHARLALEPEFDPLFPDCELGAMPPFGNLYGMDVFVARSLAADENIAFNAGSHAELVRTAYRDFERVAHPVVAAISAPARAGKVDDA